MTLLRGFVAALFATLLVYTLVVMSNHGSNLLPIFFRDIMAMTWPGQFNTDFMMMLALSAIWTGWRHHFSGVGMALATLAFFGGALFLSAYLFVMIGRSNGDPVTLLIGEERRQALG